MSQENSCTHCGNPLPTNHQGPCPECGKSGRSFSVNVPDGLSVVDSHQGQESADPEKSEKSPDAEPKDFDRSLHGEINARVATRKDDSPESWEQFKLAWRAFPIRFSWCDKYDKEFTESFKRAGGGPGRIERDTQERAVFAFFATGLSAIDTFCYSLYAIGSMVDPQEFPIAKKKHLRNITPNNTNKKYNNRFGADTISVLLQAVIDDSTYKEWRKIRNDLIHCSAPGRLIHLSVGGPSKKDDLWQHINFEIPINADTTRSRRNWLADTLSSLQADSHHFIDKYL
jgi:uncharacterized Zn finger protein (UPF0148 family)